jgi:hypothetical protein
MLLIGTEEGRVAHWFDSHPSLQERVRRIYGRHMAPMAVERADEAKPIKAEPAASEPGMAAPGWTLN